MSAAGWKAAFSLAAAIAAVLLLLTTTTTLWDRDEARFGQAAVEMLSSGDYLLPSFNGELRPQKPPLVYWLMTLSLRVFGQTELAVRMWSPIGLAVTALATFAIGRRLWSPAIGLTAMLVLVSTPLTIVQGVAATADALLLAAITVSMAIVAKALVQPPVWHDVIVLGVACGIGALVKGPVAIVLPVSVAVMSLRLVGHAVPWRRRATCALALSGTIGAGLFALWLVPATVASGGAIATQGLLRENVGRFLTPMDGHSVPLVLSPFYYLAVVTIGFLPWVAYLPRALRALTATSVARTPRAALLLAWTAVPVAIFTVSATKLPHYVLPVWPALALSVAAVLAPHGENERPMATGTPRWLIGSCFATVLVIGVLLAPLCERYKPVPHVMSYVRRSAVSGPLYTFGFEEPSLAFYGGRSVVPIHGGAALSAWSQLPGEALLVSSRAAIDEVERRTGPLGLRELTTRTGWNYVKGEWLELVAFVRRHDR